MSKYFFKDKKNPKENGQSGGASRWRVLYQGGLPRLVLTQTSFDFTPLLDKYNLSCPQQQSVNPLTWQSFTDRN